MFNVVCVSSILLNNGDRFEIGYAPKIGKPFIQLEVIIRLKFKNYLPIEFPFDELEKFSSVLLDETHPDNDGNGVFSINMNESPYESPEYFVTYDDKEKLEIRLAYVCPSTIQYLRENMDLIYNAASSYNVERKEYEVLLFEYLLTLDPPDF